MSFNLYHRKKQTHLYIGAAGCAIALIAFFALRGSNSDEAQAHNKATETVTSTSTTDNEEDLFFSYASTRELEIRAEQATNEEIKAIATESLENDKTESENEESFTQKRFVDQDTIEIGKGDTFMGQLTESGIDRGRAYSAIEEMKKVFDPRDIRVGQEITLFYKQRNDERHFAGLQFKPDQIRSIVVMEKFNGDFIAQEVAKELDERVVALGGTIRSSLSVAGQESGVPYSVLGRLINVYSWDIDFQRDIREGDTFEIMYESFTDEDGNQLKTGDILYANLTLRGRPIEIFRFEMKDGGIDWFKRDGVSVKRALMKTPVNGARLSSGFGMRKHPVLGYNKMHKGLDFAAPTGTPIYASGNGVVEEAGTKGGYGKYVRIRHRNGLHTAYAHMHRIKVHKGQRVQQKDIIGTVGSTGRSTGPHLHYEVHVNRKQVNPRRVDLPLGIKLTGTDAANFKNVMSKADDKLIAARKDGAKLAALIQKKRETEGQ